MSVYQAWQNFDKSTMYHSSTPKFAENCVPEIISYYHEKLGNGVRKIPFVIDVACGTGQVAEVIAPFCGEILAFDISPKQIEIGRKMSTHSNVNYAVESVFHMSRLLTGKWDRKADFMISAFASHYFNTPEFYKEVRKCLKVGGILAEVAFYFESIEGIPEEASQECSDFIDVITIDDGHNEEYNNMYKKLKSRFMTLDVPLEEVEYKPCEPIFIDWGHEDISNYLLARRPKSKDLEERIRKYYKDFWLKYVGEYKTTKVRFNGFVVYSRNMKPE